MADLVQIDTGTSFTPIVEFQYNGAGQNLDTGVPVVTLTRPDGTAGPASGTVTSLGAGQYSFVVAAQQQVTWLDYTAVGTLGGQSQSITGRIEWVTPPLFLLARFRRLRVNGQTPFAATGVTPIFSDADIMEKRTAVLDEFTAALGFSPVQRLARETLDAGWSALLLKNQPAGPLLTITVNGTAQLITNYTLTRAGVLRPAGAPISYGLANVVVEYVHGTERPPGKGSDMAMVYASALLNPSGFSSAVTVSTPEGISYSYEPSEVGRGGYQRWTGIRDVDRWLNMHRAVAGVA